MVGANGSTLRSRVEGCTKTQAVTAEAKRQQDDDAIPKLFGVPMKWLSLVALTFQTSWQVIVIKFARAGGSKYLNSSVVFFAEILKTLLSILLLANAEGSLSVAVRKVLQQFLGNPRGTLLYAVPALSYTIMNNLVFLSLDKLNAAVQQVTYQLKILMAAVLAVIMLGKTIHLRQWYSLVLLVIGVALVQWPRSPDGQAVLFDSSVGLSGSGVALGSDAVVGLAAVVAAAFMGGFAGVYMEMMLKQSGASLWLRNAQLGVFGALTALIGAYANDGDRIREAGFMQGYTWRTGAAIFTLATGGLLVAVVIKYADNILRQFSTALSIIITSLFSAVVLQEFVPDALFLLGAFLTIAATFIYNFSPRGK